ncbi:hypothetical protein [Streptomyces sp. NPDC017993]|uniref:hypothetical protein n=1 Tax=Streptomyces sp. NPDC017993 TaxID=3365027 RepID=UPI0037A97B92
MQLKTGRAAYYDSSGTASSIIRQLALAGVAVTWLLAGGLQEGGGVHLPQALLVAGLASVTSLFLDLLQYVWTTARIWHWVDSVEKCLRNVKGTHANVDGEEIGDVPSCVLRVMWCFFYSKVVAAAVAYSFILFDTVGRLDVS